MDRDQTDEDGDSSDRSMIAGTGAGIPDDALGPGEQLPEPPTDEQVERAAEVLGAPTAAGGAKEKLPLEGQ